MKHLYIITKELKITELFALRITMYNLFNECFADFPCHDEHTDWMTIVYSGARLSCTDWPGHMVEQTFWPELCSTACVDCRTHGRKSTSSSTLLYRYWSNNSARVVFYNTRVLRLFVPRPMKFVTSWLAKYWKLSEVDIYIYTIGKYWGYKLPEFGI